MTKQVTQVKKPSLFSINLSKELVQRAMGSTLQDLHIFLKRFVLVLLLSFCVVFNYDSECLLIMSGNVLTRF